MTILAPAVAAAAAAAACRRPMHCSLLLRLCCATSLLARCSDSRQHAEKVKARTKEAGHGTHSAPMAAATAAGEPRSSLGCFQRRLYVLLKLLCRSPPCVTKPHISVMLRPKSLVRNQSL